MTTPHPCNPCAKPLARRALALVTLAMAAAASQAATVSFAGDFMRDDDLFSTTLVLGAADVLSVQTFSFAGGLSAQAGPVAAGGFAPVLALFIEGGELLQLARGSSNVCGPGTGAADPVSGFCWDAQFSVALPAGHYTLLLSQDGNEPLGSLLTDGYSQAGQPDYTGINYLGQSGHRFVQVDATQRSGHWALDLQASTVPETATALLTLLGLGGLSAARRLVAPH
nr:DVUA0089 family protein [uncultured Roseateles sp.]